MHVVTQTIFNQFSVSDTHKFHPRELEDYLKDENLVQKSLREKDPLVVLTVESSLVKELHARSSLYIKLTCNGCLHMGQQ